MAVDAVLVTYEARGDRFDSRSERNRFYRGLFGYRRTVRRNDKVYRYEKPGLIGDMPHLKVADSVVIIRRDNLQKVQNYLREWDGRVEYELYRIQLEDHTGALEG